MIRKLLVALPLFSLILAASSARATWSIEFIPDEATGVSVEIDGEHVLDWKSVDGRSIRDVPAKWAQLEKIHVRANSSPSEKRAHVKVLWNDEEECDMRFDGTEECDASR
jgi:hypothetical protein